MDAEIKLNFLLSKVCCTCTCMTVYSDPVHGLCRLAIQVIDEYTIAIANDGWWCQ